MQRHTMRLIRAAGPSLAARSTVASSRPARGVALGAAVALSFPALALMAASEEPCDECEPPAAVGLDAEKQPEPANPFMSFTELPPDVADALNEMKDARDAARTALQQKRLDDAAREFGRALEAARKVDEVHVAATMNNLAEVYRLQGKHAESAAMYEQALPMMSAVQGAAHGSVGFICHNLGVLRLQEGRAGEALVLLQRAREIRVTTKEHDVLAETELALAAACKSTGDKQGRIEALRSCVEHSAGLPRDVLTPPKLTLRRRRLAEALIAGGGGGAEEAVQMLASALAAMEEKHGADSSYAVLAKESLADTHVLLKRPAEALALLEEALRWRESKMGATHPALKGLLGRYAATLDDLGRADDAAATRLRMTALRMPDRDRSADA